MSDLKVKVILEAVDRITSTMSKISSKFSDATAKMKKSLQSVGSAMTDVGSKISVGLSAPLAAVGALAISKSAQFEKMSASLETVTGSVEASNKAMKDLIEFSSTTPFQLEEVVGSFIKLKALGLDPSMEAMAAYGNVSSAMGKSLDQFIEAIADASTGEFERLKEFGIKASSEGNKVAFTFQGQTKVIGKNAKEIEQYLRAIGQVQFAGAMNRQMDTLSGSFSNLQDAVSTSMSLLGDELAKALDLKKHISSVTDAVKRFASAFQALPQPVKTFIAYAAIFVAVLGPVLMVLGQIVIGIGALVMGFGIAGPAILTFVGAIKAMSIALLTTPFGWIVLGIVALIAAGYMLIKNWDNVKNFFVELWDNLKWVFQQGVDWIMSYIQPLLDKVATIKNGFGRFFGGGSFSVNSSQTVTPASTPSQRVDTGGLLRIKVDSEGKASVVDMRPNNPSQKIQLDSGYILSGAY